jgi:hypothetical protein
LGVTTTVTSFPLSKHIGVGGATPAFSCQFIYSSHRKCLLPHSPVELSSHSHFYKISPLQGCWVGLPLLPPAGLFIYSSMRDCPSPPLVLRAPTLFAICLLLFIQFGFFSFFPGWGSVCPGGYADLAQGCLWEYRMPLSSPGGLLLLRQ